MYYFSSTIRVYCEIYFGQFCDLNIKWYPIQHLDKGSFPFHLPTTALYVFQKASLGLQSPKGCNGVELTPSSSSLSSDSQGTQSLLHICILHLFFNITFIFYIQQNAKEIITSVQAFHLPDRTISPSFPCAVLSVSPTPPESIGQGGMRRRRGEKPHRTSGRRLCWLPQAGLTSWIIPIVFFKQHACDCQYHHLLIPPYPQHLISKWHMGPRL